MLSQTKNISTVTLRRQISCLWWAVCTHCRHGMNPENQRKNHLQKHKYDVQTSFLSWTIQMLGTLSSQQRKRERETLRSRKQSNRLTWTGGSKCMSRMICIIAQKQVQNVEPFHLYLLRRTSLRVCILFRSGWLYIQHHICSTGVAGRCCIPTTIKAGR